MEVPEEVVSTLVTHRSELHEYQRNLLYAPPLVLRFWYTGRFSPLQVQPVVVVVVFLYVSTPELRVRVTSLLQGEVQVAPTSSVQRRRLVV